MLLFKKIKNRDLIIDDAQAKIDNKWKAVKERLATYLQYKSGLLSDRARKYILVFFCLLFGGSSIGIIIHSIITKEPVVSIKVFKPPYSLQKEQNYFGADSSITKTEYDRVEQFKNYLFQLKTDPSGTRKFDSIIQARPQLIDSIILFEKMYLQQK